VPSHFRTYFIASTANAYATMHYNIRHINFYMPHQALHPLSQNPRRGPPPPRMEQSRHPSLRFHEVDRGAVGDPYRQQDPRLRCGMAVEPRQKVPARTNSLVPADIGPVDLAGEEKGRKPAEGALESPP
jgi:hypothetical protein